MNGWIKLHRKEHAWLQVLSVREQCYYLASRLCADWDIRHPRFGTFDARDKIVARDMLSKWTPSTVNVIKNSLLEKGYYQRTEDRRFLKITNAELWFRGYRGADKIIRDSTENLHCTGYDFQQSGNRLELARQQRTEMLRHSRVI